MKNKKIGILVFAIIIAAMFLTWASSAVFQQSKPITRKIIVFKQGVLDEKAKEALIEKFGGVKIKDLSLIDGKAVFLSPKAEAELAHHSGILRIEDDIIVEALEKKYSKIERTATQPSEILPWGVDRIDAEKVWDITTGDPIKVAVIDTGIDLKHPDLKDNIKGGYNAINPRKSANDDNGHGTHVAGIIAAIDNEIGVVGVGPKIDLYAVKVLNAAGSGYLSDVIEGLDWAIKNKMNVVSMSLGTTTYSQSFEDAIKRVNAAGIVQVAAAGNNGPGSNTVNYPAKFAEVIAVSATDSNDAIASWSSRGPEVDLAAPGVNIYSTYKGSTYKTLSGTSMACPHVTGVVALLLSTPDKCDSNSDGKCSPEEVQQRLEATAKDLGAIGKDYLYGAGLVDAYSAIMT